MVLDWAGFRAHRMATIEAHGQWVGVLDRDWQPVMDVEDWTSASWPGLFADTGSMVLELAGEIEEGVQNPVVAHLLTADLETDLFHHFDDPSKLEALFHSGVHIAVERALRADGKPNRRVYRVLGLDPEGGRDYPARMTVTGVDLTEHYKHIPLWADPSNRGAVVQLQFSDVQQGSAEHVSRKLIGRNLIGYQQPSILGNMFGWTDDDPLNPLDSAYGDPGNWSRLNPGMHSVICSPIPSGLPSEWCIVEARWDNAWDLMKATWDAAGVLPTAELWWPGDPQPFPVHTTLRLPTVVLDFLPRSTVTGAAGLLSQGWASIRRRIDADRFTSVTEFADVPTPTADGRAPWVVFDFIEGPRIPIRKSTDHTFVVGGKSPKGLNDVLEVGIKTAFAAVVSAIPILGGPAAELIKGGGELLARLSADRFLNINQYVDRNRKAWHGRSGYIGVAKPGQANSFESLQKAWQAKSETAGGLSVEFTVDDSHPYRPGIDFDLGDTVGVRAWGVIWAAYVSELTWTSDEGAPVAWTVKLGNLSRLSDPEALLAANAETVRAVVGRLATEVGN